jgi:hypothetical protein
MDLTIGLERRASATRGVMAGFDLVYVDFVDHRGLWSTARWVTRGATFNNWWGEKPDYLTYRLDRPGD